MMSEAESAQKIDEGLRIYVKRRRLEKNSRENCLPLTEFALRCAVTAELGCPRPFDIIDAAVAPQEIVAAFESFKSFVTKAPDPYKSELYEALWPVFVNAFMDLVLSKDTIRSKQFRLTYSHLFIDVEIYRPLLHAFKLINSADDLLRSAPITLHRKNKIHVSMSSECWKFLERFLRNSTYIKEVFHRNIDVKIQLIDSTTIQERHFISAHNVLESHLKRNLPRKSLGNSVIHDDTHDSMDMDSPRAEERTNSNESRTFRHTETCDTQQPLNDLCEAIRNLRNQVTLPNLVVLDIKASDLPATVSTAAATDDAIAIALDNGVILLENRDIEETEDDPCLVKLPDRLHVALSAANYSEDEPENIQRTRRARSRLVGHTDCVTGLKFAPKAQLLLSSSSDCYVRAWNAKSGVNVARYDGHQYPIWDLALSPQGIYFATASQDMTARLWTTCRTFPLRIYAGHMSHVDRVAFHPNCNYLATASSDSCLRMFAVQSSNMVRLFPETHTGSIYSLVFSPNGNYLAAAGEERVVKIWDLRTSEEICRLEGHSDTISSLAYSKNGDFLVSGDLRGQLKIWDVKNVFKATCSFDLNENGYSSEIRKLDNHYRDNVITAIKVKNRMEESR